MSSILGSNGDRFNKQGNHTFYDGPKGKHDSLFHSGSGSFGMDDRMFNAGSTSFFGNQQIFRSGNTYSCGNKTYKKIGNTLYGPNGEWWQGGDDMTDDDIRDIISHNN